MVTHTAIAKLKRIIAKHKDDPKPIKTNLEFLTSVLEDYQNLKDEYDRLVTENKILAEELSKYSGKKK